MPPRKTQPQPAPPDLPPERAYAALSKQLGTLKELQGRSYKEVEHKENEWAQLTANIISRAFGSSSSNRSQFSAAMSAGDHFVRPAVSFDGYSYGGDDSALDQSNYEKRMHAYEGVLNSCLAELRLFMPATEIQEVFEPGQEYEFYRAIKTILGFATNEIFVIDPYVSSELFETYADAIPRSVSFRLLSGNLSQAVLSLGQKYASGGNFQLRSSSAIHDRVLFSDNRVWMCGQSLKDAAKKKPTYIVEHDEPLMRSVYENVWGKATVVL